MLIHGAGGGVGDLAMQIAKARGAYVVGTASAAKHEFVRSLGADELMDHQTCDFAAVVGDLDVVLDSLGGEIARRSISVLRPGGILTPSAGATSTWPPVPGQRGVASPAFLSSPTIPASKPWPDWSILGSSVSISRRRCP